MIFKIFFFLQLSPLTEIQSPLFEQNQILLWRTSSFEQT